MLGRAVGCKTTTRASALKRKIELTLRLALFFRVGLLPLGIDALGLWGGILMLVSGVLNIIIHALLPVHPYSFYGRRTSDPGDDEEARFNE